jgi:hypothetical protein
MADAMARAVVHARDRGRGEPGGLLAQEAGHEVRGLGLGARQALGEEPQRMQRETVAIRVRVHRADGLHGVVDAAHAGGEPQPAGRVQRERRIEDHRARTDVSAREGVLQTGAWVRAAAELGSAPEA